MKKIVITGSEGFIGQALLEKCLGENITPIGVDLKKKSGHDYEFHEANLLSSSLMELIPEDASTLIHLAGLMISRNATGETGASNCFDTNVIGTLNIARAAAHRNINHFVFASTEWVYGEEGTQQEVSEEEPINIMKLSTEYALSKAVSEANLRQLHLEKKIPAVTILRFSIAYGPGKDSAVSTLFGKVRKEEPIEVGSLETGRRFIHVKDIASGVLATARQPHDFSIYNLSYDHVITLSEIIQTSEKVLGKKARVTEIAPQNKNVRNPSNKKAKKELGWKPVIDLETGLKTLL